MISVGLGSCVQTPAPTCDGLGACDGVAAPHARTCIDHCLPTWAPLRADLCSDGCPAGYHCSGLLCAADQWCPLDSCDPAVYESPARGLLRVCGSGLHCTADAMAPAGMGVCTPELSLLDACTPGSDECGDGLVCLDDTCPGVDDLFIRNPPDHPVCLGPRIEGQTCDSNAADLALGLATGCAPCEEGTFCAPRRAIDPDHPEATDSVCVRSCAAANGLGDPSLCACQTDTVRCLPPTAPVLRGDGSSAGTWFCTPCTPDGVAGCGETNGKLCCDDQARCEQVTDVLTGVDRDVCCRGPALGDPLRPDVQQGAECSTSSRRQECCPGSFCDSTGHCQSCARAGDAAGGRPCCPGTIAIESGICAACADTRALFDFQHNEAGITYCSNETFLVSSVADQTPPTPDDVDAAFIPSSTVAFPYEYRDALGASLDHTAGMTRTAEYSLSRQHHAFLFDAPITDTSTGFGGAFGKGTHFIELPPDDDGLIPAASVPLPDPDWTRFRIYDSGQCSAFYPWETVAAALEIPFNQQIAGLIGHGAAGPVSTSGVSVTPIFDGRAGDIYGVLEARDRLEVNASYHLGSLAACNDVEMTIAMTMSLTTVEGFVENELTRISDRALFVGQGPGHMCERADAHHYVCHLPVAPTSSTPYWTTRNVDFPREAGLYDWRVARGTPDELDLLDLAFASVECAAYRDQYICNLPRFTEDLICCPTAPFCPVPPLSDPTCQTARTARSPWGDRRRVQCNAPGVGDIPGSCENASPGSPFFGYYEYAPGLRFDGEVDTDDAQVLPAPRPITLVPNTYDFEAAISQSDLTVEIPGCLLQDVVEEAFQTQSRALAHQTGSALSAILAGTFGATPGAYGLGGQSLACSTDAGCQAAAPFGQTRSRCVRGACSVRMEPRRMNIMPAGIEFVVAQTSSDPQAPLFAMGPFGIGGALFPNLSCAPTRNWPVSLTTRSPYSLTRYTTPDLRRIDPRSITATNGTAILHNRPDTAITFCERVTTPNGPTNCICPQTGTRCQTIDLTLAGYSIPSGRIGCRPPAGQPDGPLECCTTGGTACSAPPMP